MKKFYAALALSLALATPAFADSHPSASEPCTRSQNAEVDALRCQLAVASQSLAQVNGALIALTAKDAMQANDLANAQAQIKTLQARAQDQKKTNDAPSSDLKK